MHPTPKELIHACFCLENLFRAASSTTTYNTRARQSCIALLDSIDERNDAACLLTSYSTTHMAVGTTGQDY